MKRQLSCSDSKAMFRGRPQEAEVMQPTTEIY